jgi:hypothetical protein
LSGVVRAWIPGYMSQMALFVYLVILTQTWKERHCEFRRWCNVILGS